MRQYDMVRLITDRYNADGLKKGDIGVILEDYGDGNFEVDFSEYNSSNVIIQSFTKNDLEKIE